MRQSVVLRVVAAAVAVVLAGLRFAVLDEARFSIDATFLGLLGAAFLILALPWERLRSLKAGGLEGTLEGPRGQGAISALGLDRLEDEQLRARLKAMAPLIGQISGTRVLWIDDKPRKVLGERRLLRALGVDVVAATSSDGAVRELLTDNDFDLIISDVQRAGASHKWIDDAGDPLHEGANFAVLLLRSQDERVLPVPPILFYSAYEWARLRRFTRIATSESPTVEVCRPRRAKDTPAASDLIGRAIVILSEARSSPISVGANKEPTGVGTEQVTVEQWANSPDYAGG